MFILILLYMYKLVFPIGYSVYISTILYSRRKYIHKGSPPPHPSPCRGLVCRGAGGGTWAGVGRGGIPYGYISILDIGYFFKYMYIYIYGNTYLYVYIYMYNIFINVYIIFIYVYIGVPNRLFCLHIHYPISETEIYP